jgi:hypothetical protein
MQQTSGKTFSASRWNDEDLCRRRDELTVSSFLLPDRRQSLSPEVTCSLNLQCHNIIVGAGLD